MHEKEFTLPDFQGIHEVLRDLREWSTEHGTEKLIALRKDGTRVLEIVGDEDEVAIPGVYAGHIEGCLLLHNHPAIPCELSRADTETARYLGAAGQLAIADDGTISWTSGISDWVYSPMVWNVHVEGILRLVFRGLGGKPDKGDPAWVTVAHRVNRMLLEAGVIKDYHVHLGPQATAILKASGDL